MKKTTQQTPATATPSRYAPLAIQTTGIFRPGDLVHQQCNGVVGVVFGTDSTVFCLRNRKSKEFLVIHCHVDYGTGAIQSYLHSFIKQDTEFDPENYDLFVTSADGVHEKIEPFSVRWSIQAGLEGPSRAKVTTGLTVIYSIRGYMVDPHGYSAHDPRSVEEQTLAKECAQYVEMRDNLLQPAKLVETVNTMIATPAFRSGAEIAQALQGEIMQFFKEVQHQESLIPYWGLKEKIADDVYTMASYCGYTVSGKKEPHARGIAKLLMQTVCNPIRPLAPVADDTNLESGNNTPLHYACLQLKNSEGSSTGFKLKVIIALFLLFGDRDSINAKGKFALDYLKNMQDQEFYALCQKFLAIPKPKFFDIEKQASFFNCSVTSLILQLLTTQYYINHSTTEQLITRLGIARKTLHEAIGAKRRYQLTLPIPVADEFSHDQVNGGHIAFRSDEKSFYCIAYNLDTKTAYVIGTTLPRGKSVEYYLDRFISKAPPNRYKITLACENASRNLSLVDYMQGSLCGRGFEPLIHFIDKSDATDSTPNFIYNLADGTIATPTPHYVEYTPGIDLEALAGATIYAHQYYVEGSPAFIEVVLRSLVNANQETNSNTRAFIESLIQEGRQAPIMPFWTATFIKRLQTIGRYAHNGDFENLAKELFVPICNPVSPIDPAGGNLFTPLHYACKKLSENENDHDLNLTYKLIIALLLLTSGIDRKVNNKYALDYLKTMKDTQFRQVCARFVDNFKNLFATQMLNFNAANPLKIALVNIHYTWQEHKDKPSAQNAYKKLSAEIINTMQQLHAPEMSANTQNRPAMRA